MNDFENFWKNNFNSCVPLGHVLRTACPDKWIRFHALPKSKRYPETQEENEIILERANKLATACLGKNSKCWVVRPVFADEMQNPTEKRALKELLANSFIKSFSTIWPFDVDDTDGGNKLDIYVKKFNWEVGACDSMFLKIANDEEQGLIVDVLSKQIFAPYDGGFDLILRGSDQVNIFKMKYSEWMSSRKDWL